MNLNRYLMLAPLPLLFAACSDDDDEAYPPIITEFADLSTDASGALSSFTTDAGRRFAITNAVNGYKSNTTYRVVAGYTDEGNQQARLYTLTAAWLLRDSTATLRQDPAGVVAAWRAGKYINMQLAPMTRGGNQYWGFSVDSVSAGKCYVSLHHNQNRDEQAYTATLYASLPVDSIKEAESGDSIILSIRTSASGYKSWRFSY